MSYKTIPVHVNESKHSRERCYGHSRFRELLVGGVTRTLVQSMAVPTLMAH